MSAYTYGHSPAIVGVHAARSATREAAFFLPHLTPGMRLLDVGCGPGTITLGLAAAVSPGEAVGIDVEETVLDRARTLAKQERAANLRFEQASAHTLPFDDDTFDAVFAHTLLEHVPDPRLVLTEMRRVLRPGGVLGVRDCDWGSGVFWPADPLVQQAADLYARVWSHNGGHPNLGRQLRALLRAAGFTRIATSTSFRWDGSHDDPTNGSPAFGALLAQRLLLPNFADPIIANGWADQATLQRISQACTQWSTHPDAYVAMIMTEAVAWNE
jgi:ubiquinone/menaquinone biosynthesis C-methylase UbiE